MSFAGYRCGACGGRFRADEAVYRCPRCAGNLEVVLDFGAVSRDAIASNPDRSLWRYAPLLPVSVPGEEEGPLRLVGGTPLFSAPRAARRLGLARVWVKDDGREPTASLKDRASAVVVQRARAIGARRIITASTGNAGVALAAMANAAGLEAIILVPENAPPAKIAQLQIFGATLFLVRGSYDDAFELSSLASEKLGIYCRNTGQNPFTVEGKKTVAFEIAEQLGWRAPEWVVVPVGDGNILMGVFKGFRELVELGFIPSAPKILGVQAEGSSPIARAFQRGSAEIEPVSTHTLADSIAAGRPADGRRALEAVRASGGAFVIVSDDEILAAIAALARDATVFAEPAAAAGHAGLEAALRQGVIRNDAEVLLLVTGNGLKDIGAATRAAGTRPRLIEKTLDALTSALTPEKDHD